MAKHLDRNVCSSCSEPIVYIMYEGGINSKNQNGVWKHEDNTKVYDHEADPRNLHALPSTQTPLQPNSSYFENCDHEELSRREGTPNLYDCDDCDTVFSIRPGAIIVEAQISPYLKSEAEQAIEALKDMMNDKNLEASVRYDAARTILDQANRTNRR